MSCVNFVILLFKTIGIILYSTLKSLTLCFVPKKYLFKSVKQNIILITGAGSGLGAALSVKFAKRNARLVLWDINKEGLEKTMENCRKYQSNDNIAIYQVDVTDRAQVMETAEKIKSKIGFVDILINNAGIVNGKSILDLTPQAIERTFNVNVFSHFWTIQAFLPEMFSRNSGHIVSIASMAGLSGVNKLTDYCASKHAAVGLQDALMNEIISLKKFGVKTLTVCPFYINTGMFDGIKLDCPIIDMLDLDYTATKIEEAVLTNASFLIIPRLCYVLLYLKSFLPADVFINFATLVGSNQSMDTFIGRK